MSSVSGLVKRVGVKIQARNRRVPSRRAQRSRLTDGDPIPLRHRQRHLGRHGGLLRHREEAEPSSQASRRDEPDFEDDLWVEAVEFEQSVN
jgi:hypothetical protein